MAVPLVRCSDGIGGALVMRFDLTDEHQAVTELMLPLAGQGGARRDDHQVLSGILRELRTSIPWDEVPERCRPSEMVYDRHDRWSKQGIWRAMYEALSERLPWSVEMIDRASVKAHRASAGAEKGG